jgi:protein SCO1/2
MAKKWFAVFVFLLMAIGFGGCASEYVYGGTVFDPPLELEDFELMDTSRQPFHLSDIKGDIALVFFGYTFCPDVCPLTLADVRTALSEIENRERVKVIFVSVDPERDTPEDVRKYLDAFDTAYIGLTDDYAKTEEVMQQFGAYAEKEEVSESAAGYLVNHTARLYLINPEQQLFLTYPFGFSPDDLRDDLAHLLTQ